MIEWTLDLKMKSNRVAFKAIQLLIDRLLAKKELNQTTLIGIMKETMEVALLTFKENKSCWAKFSQN